MTTISLRLNDDENALIRRYAELKQLSVSEVIRQTLMERIEEEYDLSVYEKALNLFRKDSTTYSLDEVEEALGLK